ncbi:hypothetical protein NMG60_11031349 [Bertholletia excelsa]
MMKGRYVDDKDRANMFAKLQQHPFHPHPTTSATKKVQPPNSDDATIEVVGRRPRGRPPGSKNKPKPPVIITRDANPSMSPYVLEVSAGADIIAAVTRFSRCRNVGLCVISASGAIAGVSLRQPAGTVVTFHGHFEMLSLSATILSTATSLAPEVLTSLETRFSVTIAGPQGQMIGGVVVGPLVAAGNVYVMATAFGSPAFHRLPGDENDVRSPAAAANGGGESAAAAEEGSGCGVNVYSCHVPSEVIWTPTARQPPPRACDITGEEWAVCFESHPSRHLFSGWGKSYSGPSGFIPSFIAN